MCSRTVSDTANRLLKRTDSEGSSSAAEKKSSAASFSCLRSLPSAPKLSQQGKRVFKEGRNRRCLPFLPSAVGTANAPAAAAAESLPRIGEPQKLCLRIPVREYDLNAKTVRHRSAERFREVFTFSCPEALCDDSCRRNVRNRRRSRRTS